MDGFGLQYSQRLHMENSKYVRAEVLGTVPPCFFVMKAQGCRAGCVEVDSDTEAVAGNGFKLGCISCKKRSEVEATAVITWLFQSADDEDFREIYSYESVGVVQDEQFEGRIDWNGSKNTRDLQDGSIYLHNVTFNDSGVYKCNVNRLLMYEHYEFNSNATKVVHLNVVPKGVSSRLGLVNVPKQKLHGSAGKVPPAPLESKGLETTEEPLRITNPEVVKTARSDGHSWGSENAIRVQGGADETCEDLWSRNMGANKKRGCLDRLCYGVGVSLGLPAYEVVPSCAAEEKTDN
ncbi:SCN1B protein, partial [Polypterus senegalus]